MDEIIQPDIEISEQDRHSKESYRIYEKWLREISTQLDLNTRKLILGDALSSIVGDDANLFNWACLGDQYHPEISKRARNELLDRLDWEIGLEELPENIISLLEETKQSISVLKWEEIDGFLQAEKTWRKAEKFIKEQISNNQELKDAMNYLSEKQKELNKYWYPFFHNIEYPF